MHLDTKGVIGCHQSVVVPQLLLILNGSGYIRSKKEEYFIIQLGDAVFGEKHEWYQTKSDTGLTAIYS